MTGTETRRVVAPSDVTRAQWLLRLRASAIFLEAIVLGASFVLGTPPSSPAILGVVFAAQVMSNIGGVYLVWRAPTSQTLAWLLAIDLVAFTALLALTGGASNPFSFLYLVFIALAAVVLSAWQSIALVALSILGFGSLFLIAPSEVGHGHGHAMRGHVIGMWVACSIGAVFIVVFLQGLTRDLRTRELELTKLRAVRVQNERLAALGTLAAGAAHELSTPLSTIAVAAGELIDVIESDAALKRLEPEALSIRGEVDRCRAVLEQLAADAGQDPADGLQDISAGTLVDIAVAKATSPERVRIEYAADAANALLHLPPRIAARALRGLINNALAADSGEISLDVTAKSNHISITVRDAGDGMSSDVLARSLEPFFTTREQGEGMGLGLFLARNVAERLGGHLALESTPGEGTRAIFVLPVANRSPSTTFPPARTAEVVA